MYTTNQPLNVAYIDIKAAFNSVDRAALWKALRSSGAPPFLIHLIEHLHTGTTLQVRVGGEQSEPFETTSGVRQGCVLTPALFCIAIDWILSSCTGTMGTTVGSSKFMTKIMLMMPCYFLTALLSGRTSVHSDPSYVQLHRSLLRWSCTYDVSEYLLVENQEPELRPWGNTSSSAITRSRCRVHRPLHISWQISTRLSVPPEILGRIGLA